MLELQWTFCTSCGRPLSSQSASDQAPPPATPKPADMSAESPRVSSTFQTSPSQAVTMPLSDQPRTQPESLPSREVEAKPSPQKFEASQETTVRYSEAPELYAALDLYETTSAAPRSGQLEPEKTYSVSDAQGPTQPLAQQVPVSVQRTTEQKTAPVLSMMESYGRASETPSQFRWWHGAILGLFFLLLAGLGIGGWYWWANRGSVAQTTPQVDSNPALPPGNPSASPTSTSTVPGQKTTSPSADEEIKRLRERRIGAKPSDADEIIAAFEDAEKKYPIDYRFPYERAKLSIKGITSHHEAFGALSLAAEKAIDNGKSQEMLDSLMADKDGDFYKLSRGHREWQTLLQALNNKDKRGLNELHH